MASTSLVLNPKVLNCTEFKITMMVARDGGQRFRNEQMYSKQLLVPLYTAITKNTRSIASVSKGNSFEHLNH